MNDKILIYFVLLIFLTVNKASACSCSRGARLVKHEIKRSTLVLVGKVIAIEEVNIKSGAIKTGQDAYFNKVTLLVSKLFKGKKTGRKVVVYTGLGKGDCGFYFRIGRQYILYGNNSASPFWRNKEASPKGLEDACWTDICTRTQGLNSKELSALRRARRARLLEKRKLGEKSN
jgi:hypothetical protein